MQAPGDLFADAGRAAPLSAHPVLAPDILTGFHLLEADAGTGKTWTISGLVVRALVERGLGIEQILVVTFTNAATAELAARIRERIGQLAQLIEDRLAGRESEVRDPFCLAFAPTLEDPRAALGRLRIALSRIDEAAVRTIHAFCHRVIDEHALSIGMAAGMNVEATGGAWIERGVAQWWRGTVEDAPADVLGLLRLAGVSPASLANAVRAIDARPGARVVPEPLDWRALAAEHSQLVGRLRVCLAEDVEPLREWLSVKSNRDGTKFRSDHVESRLAKLRAFVDEEGDALVPAEVERFTTQAFRGDQGKWPVPALPLVAVCDALASLARRALALPAMVAIEAWHAIAAQRSQLQQASGAIDHDELLRIVHDALMQEPGGAVLAASLRERYPLALVDECQDTDALQWRIFRRVYEPGPAMTGHGLILVGDPKQAIYAFRSADVYSYLEARAAGPVRHGLHENQRSVRPLIEAVNALFDRTDAFMVPEIGFVPTREGARERRRFEVPPALARTALTVALLAGDGDTSAAMLDRAQATQLAVRSVVSETARLLGCGEARLGGEPLRARDVAVLVDSHRQGTLIKDGLAAAGIGAIEISRDSVLESRECDELIRVVAAVADPADRGLVRSALATSMLGFDAVALLALGESGDADTRVLEALGSARRTWAALGPQAAIRRLMAAFDVGPRLAGLRDGDRRLTNLMHLLELAAASPEAREGAHAGLRWLGRLRADPTLAGQDAGELRLESDEDLVRIVTVHKSKGLEFPVVFLPFAWAGRERRGAAPLSYHVDGAAVLDLAPDPEGPAADLACREAHAESVRALYVALTRAEQRCYVLWGAGMGAQFAPLAWLLHDLDPAKQPAWDGRSKDPPVLTPEVARTGALAWRERAQRRCPGSLSVVDAADLAGEPGHGRDAGQGRTQLPGASPAVTPAAPGAPPSGRMLHARPFTARIPSFWIRSSFSALTAAGAQREADSATGRVLAATARPDHDQLGDLGGAGASATPPGGESRPAGKPAAVDIRDDFPAGALAGTCLHGILEHTDFAQGVSSAVVATWLARSGYEGIDVERVRAWLDAVLSAPLPDPCGGEILLPGLDGERVVREMEFVLPARELDNRALFAAVGRFYPFDASAVARTWTGYLNGFIDLVFEDKGRWYLLDWKSNRLPGTSSAYERAALESSIGEHGYALQFCLYALALHRLLRARLPGYDYQRHFGGVHYVYLRGAGLGHAGGVYATRPPPALIETLDRLFMGGA